MIDATDYFAIQNLIHAYAYRLDGGCLDDLGELFAHADVHFEGIPGPVRSDPRAITKMFTDFLQLYDGRPRTRHVISNVMIEFDSVTEAHATSYVVVFQQTGKLPLQPIITGDYADRFVKLDGKWRFAERYIRNDLFGNLSAHGKYALGPDQIRT